MLCNNLQAMPRSDNQSHIALHSSNKDNPSISLFVLLLLRCLWVCQQPALVPVDQGAAVHQPCGSSASLFPPALPFLALAPGPQNWRSAEKHRPWHLLHQQPTEVRGNQIFLVVQYDMLLKDDN